jgi:Sulfotransferase family
LIRPLDDVVTRDSRMLVDALLEAARTQTGLDDFGDDSFREGLDILVRSVRDEARLNVAGEAFLYPRIIGHLGQRLQVEDWYRRHPEIADVVLGPALIGVGLPRTGSTALTFLLAQDPQARSLLQYEAAQPCPPPSTVTGLDPRIGHQERVGTKSHVPSSTTGPIECQDLMALDFRSHIFQAFAQIPTYSAWLLDADLTSTYAYERRVLQLLQWGCPVRPWRLKCPTHLLFLDDLDTAFPEARFVMTHRDPTDVIPSVCAVYADIVGSFTDDVDTHYLGRLNVDHWSTGMRRALTFRDQGADHRFFDIGFLSMQEDPVAEVTALYEWLGEPVSEAFAAGMRAWWAENAANREPGESADAQRFGLSAEAVRPLFADYVVRMEKWT